MADAYASRLRLRRHECGLSQAELAHRAGVSRQLVAAAESGVNVPATGAALALARALGATVEALFAMPADAPVPALGERLPERASVRVGRVGDRTVVSELPDHGTAGAAWATADGFVEGGELRLFPRAVPAGLVIAGCDPALGVAEEMLRGLGPRSLLAVPASTGTALDALARGRIHAAVVHGPVDGFPAPAQPVVRWRLAGWRVGLGLVARRGSIESALRDRRPLVRRDRTASSQQALERAADGVGMTVPTGGPTAAGHIEAARLASTLRGAGVTTESAAGAFGLSFLALEHHDVEIWLGESWRDEPAAQELGHLLTSAAFTERVAAFGGYDLTGCGTRV